MQKKYLFLIIPLFMLAIVLDSFAEDKKSDEKITPKTEEKSEPIADTKKASTPPPAASEEDKKDHIVANPDDCDDEDAPAADLNDES